ICIAAERIDVVEECRRQGVPISMIETLQSGGTRVVMHNARDAALLATHFGNKVLTGPVTRTTERFRRPDSGSR
ncbi:MAG: hypothetical protein ABW184_06085, partial [Sphingobium sp.]